MLFLKVILSLCFFGANFYEAKSVLVLVVTIFSCLFARAFARECVFVFDFEFCLTMGECVLIRKN